MIKSKVVQQKMSIENWCQMTHLGNVYYAEIRLNGKSMEPLIRSNRDYITISPLIDNITKGDIVLFKDIVCNQYIVHRVCSLSRTQVRTWGDNCDSPDTWVSIENVLGKVIRIKRGDVVFNLSNKINRPVWLVYAHICHTKIRFRKFIYQVYKKFSCHSQNK